MTIFMLFNFAFDHFFIGEPQNPQIAKKHILQVFWKKCHFLQFVDFEVLQLKKWWKAKLKSIKLASVSSVICEILIKIGPKMTIFIYEFFGINIRCIHPLIIPWCTYNIRIVRFVNWFLQLQEKWGWTPPWVATMCSLLKRLNLNFEVN